MQKFSLLVALSLAATAFSGCLVRRHPAVYYQRPVYVRPQPVVVRAQPVYVQPQVGVYAAPPPVVQGTVIVR